MGDGLHQGGDSQAPQKRLPEHGRSGSGASHGDAGVRSQDGFDVPALCHRLRDGPVDGSPSDSGVPRSGERKRSRDGSKPVEIFCFTDDSRTKAKGHSAVPPRPSNWGWHCRRNVRRAKGAKPKTPPRMRRGWMQVTTSTSPLRGEKFFSLTSFFTAHSRNQTLS